MNHLGNMITEEVRMGTVVTTADEAIDVAVEVKREDVDDEEEVDEDVVELFKMVI